MSISAPPQRLGRPYFLLVTGQSLAALGAATNAIGLVLLMLESDDPVRGIGSVQLMLMVPWIVLGPLTGAIADRWPKRRTIILCDLARGLLALGLLWGHGSQPLLLALVLAMTCFSVLFAPTLRAFIPELVSPEALPRAVSAYEFSSNAARIAGALLGGLLSVQFGFVGVCVTNAVAFFVSAVLTALIRQRGEVAAPAEEEKSESVLASMRGGFTFIGGHPSIRFVVGFFAIATAFFAAIPVLLPVVVTTRLHLDDAAYGTLVSADTVGALIGTALTARIGKTRAKLQWMTLGVAVWGVTTLLIVSVSPGLLTTIALYLAIGCISSIIDVVYEIFLQSTVPADYLGRVFSLDLAISNATALGAIIIVSFAIPASASQYSAEVLSIGVIIVGLAGLLLAVRHTRRRAVE